MSDQQGRADLLAGGRARSSADLGPLGDPERWGGAAEWQARIPGPVLVTTYSHQVIRVQCDDLIARAWDISCRWSMVKRGPVLLTRGSILGLEVTFGAGQATANGSILVLAQALGAPTILAVEGSFLNVSLDVPAPNGAVQASFPTPAVALAIRGVFSGSADGVQDLNMSIVVTVAPRALSGGQGLLKVTR